MEEAVAELLKLGLAGIMILGEAIVCVHLWRRNTDLQDRLVALQGERAKEAGDRAKDERERLDNLAGLFQRQGEILEEQGKVLEDMRDKINRRGK